MSMVTSYDPRTGADAGSAAASTDAEVYDLVAQAGSAAAAVAAAPPLERRRWLRALADALEAHLEELVALADLETGLGPVRLSAEVARTADQLRFYGDVTVEGSFLGASLETDASGTIRLARVNQPVGLVATFGASNFPFVFGMLGNDTGSALAAGCPVVVKAHDAHVAVGVRTAEIAQEALAAAGAPEGAFGHVVGFDAGVSLVRCPGTRAVGFTGSQQGGLSLWRLANEREVVIPVYAEMGTVNPVVVTPAGAADIASVARGFVGAFTQGSGQYCTKPGLLFAPRSAAALAEVTRALEQVGPAVMLTRRIAESLRDGTSRLLSAGATTVLVRPGSGTGWSGDVTLLTAPVESIRAGSRLLDECFGPVAIVVEYDDVAEVVTALGELQGALAASVFAGGSTDPDAAPLVSRLAGMVGRVCVNAWTPGVACTWAQHHGGPWPATSDPRATSMGAAALDRWVRPVAYQDVPAAWLPPAVQPGNPWKIVRRVDGVLVTGGTA
jgi:NADP-dependent aldehyde dehydrogenase